MFFSWAWAEPAMLSAAIAAISPPDKRAALRTSIQTSLEIVHCISWFLLTPITGAVPTDVKRLASLARRLWPHIRSPDWQNAPTTLRAPYAAAAFRVQAANKRG